MPGHLPIAGASRTLRTLLRDRMQQATIGVTLAPPDVTPDGASGLRVNLYLLHVAPNPHLANLPPRADAAGRVPIRPPLGIEVISCPSRDDPPEAWWEDPVATRFLVNELLKRVY